MSKTKEVTIYQCQAENDGPNFKDLLELLTPEFMGEIKKVFKKHIAGGNPYRLTDEMWPTFHTLLQAQPSKMKITLLQPYSSSYITIQWPFTNQIHVFLHQLEACNFYKYSDNSEVFSQTTVLKHAATVLGIDSETGEEEDQLFYTSFFKTKLLYCALVTYLLNSTKHPTLKYPIKP